MSVLRDIRLDRFFFFFFFFFHIDMTLFSEQPPKAPIPPTRRNRYRPRYRSPKRVSVGINYREMMIALDPATAARMGLTARPGTPTPGLFDHIKRLST